MGERRPAFIPFCQVSYCPEKGIRQDGVIARPVRVVGEPDSVAAQTRSRNIHRINMVD
jgi:hypothetical protein